MSPTPTRNAGTVLQDIAARQERSAARAKALGARKRWFRIENAVTDDDGRKRAKVYLYDAIGSWYGVTPADFVQQLNDLEDDVEVLELHINSPGGSVFDGIAIMNALRQHDAEVVGIVDGLAASAASFIAVGGCDELVMAAHSELMIHDAWGLCVGNAADMAKMAEDLDRISDNIASVYARKAGGSADSWRATMREDTWYSAADAVAAGLADRTDADPDDDSTDDEDASTENRWGRDIFAALAGTSTPATEPPSASAARVPSPVAPASGDTTQEGSAMAWTEEQMTNLRQKLGVAVDADEATILAALDEALDEGAQESPAAAGTTTTANVPEGMALVDAATLDSLREDAAAGREARTVQQAAERAAVVDAAVRDGRIPVARREHWVNAIAADPGAADTLAALEPGLIPLDELGHASTDTESEKNSDISNKVYPKEG